MSERESPVSGVLETQQAEAVVQATAGQQLRAAREAAGLHVAALAGALKVPVHKLEALEADDYASFSDHVFMRGLASSICRTLGIAPQPVLDKLPRSATKGFDAPRMYLNAPIKERAGKSGGGMAAGGGGVSRKAIGAVIVLLLAAAAVYFLPDGLFDRDTAGDGTPTTVSQPVQAVPAPAAALPAAPAGDMPAAALPVAPAAAPAAAAAEALPAAASVAAAATATEAPALPGQAPLAFSATASSWVQVRDARGAVVLSKTLAAGESAQVSATLPVQVVVGRVDATTMQVRGQAFDLVAASQGKNVARFEVK